jgi:hypothetical protein
VKRQGRPNALRGKTLAGFSQLGRIPKPSANNVCMRLQPRKWRPTMIAAKSSFPDCTKLGHTPVDGLHSNENEGDKAAKISLTFSSIGVKTHSFFDSFPRLPGWL